MESMIDRDLVKKLLMKRQKTGKDMGRLIMLAVMGDIEQKEPPMTADEFYEAQAEFYRRVNDEEFEAWKRDKEIEAYKALSRLHDSLIYIYNDAGDRYWQFYAGFSHLYGTLERIAESERAQRISDAKPAVMTAAQYEAQKAKAAEALREGRESYYSLLFGLLGGLLCNAAEMKIEPTKEILDAMEEARNEPIEGKLCLKAYNARRGYFTVDRGTGRSDQMTREEWRQEIIDDWESNGGAANTTLEMTLDEKWEIARKHRLLDAYSLFFRGKDAFFEPLFRGGVNPGCYLYEEEEAALLGGFVDLDVTGKKRFDYPPELLEAFTRALIYGAPILRWHECGDEAAGANADDLLNFIAKAAFSNELRWREDSEKHIKAFKADFAGLYGALHEWIVQHIPQAADFAEGDAIFDEFIDRADLEARGVAIREPTEREIIEAGTGKPAVADSIAILRGGADALEGGAEQAAWLDSLRGKERTLRNDAETLIYPALGYLYAYNELMGIFEQVYSLPNLAAIAHMDTAELEEKIESYNTLLYKTYHGVLGSEEEKKQKRDFIKRAFPELAAEAAKPSEGAVKMMAAQIKKMAYSKQANREYRYLDDFIFSLCESAKAMNEE